MNKIYNFKNLTKVLLFLFACTLWSCDEDDTLLDGPTAIITSDQFDETLSFTGTNEETVNFEISVSAPNGLSTISSDILLGGELESNIYSYSNTDNALTEYTTESISFEILEEYVDESLTVLIISEDLAGQVDSLELFVTATGKYASGLFIVNEGGFGNGNASISYLDKENSTVEKDFFYTKTGQFLGDQAQSMTIHERKGFILVQNSSKIEIININNGESLHTLTSDNGIASPRYLIGISEEKAYFSDWGADGVSGTVKVLDTENYTITKTIETGSGSNQMVLVNDYVYVANAGGWGSDNTIVIIDTASDEVVNTLEVGDNPSSLVVDGDDNIWFSGSGKLAYNADWSIDTENSTPGFLGKINTSNDQIEFEIEASTVNVGPSRISIDSEGGTLIFKYKSGVYSSSISIDASSSLDSFTEIIGESFYGLSIDQSEDHIIGALAPDFSNSGSIKRYTLDGTFVDEYTVGIGPNGIAF